jgi:uncharacterized membrane protein
MNLLVTLNLKKGRIDMYKTTLAGHPLHPILVPAPAALLPASLVLDLMYFVTRKKSYADAAYYNMVGGFFGGLAAGVAGAIDYFSIPTKTKTKNIANIHASLNLAVFGLYSVNLLLRRGKRVPTGTLPLLLSAIGSAGIFVSAWYGGEMVYKHGVRVKGVHDLEQATELKLPGDETIEKTFDKIAEKVKLDEEEIPKEKLRRTAGGED